MQRQSARGVHSAECGVVVSEEAILALARYQEGRELLESVLPEDSYVFRMQQYQDIVNPPDEKGLLELSWDYVKRVAELYLDRFIEGERNTRSSN